MEVQIIAYRNYNVKAEQLIEVSPWETKSDQLESFLNRIKCKFGIVAIGTPTEAIEVALDHCLKEQQINK